MHNVIELFVMQGCAVCPQMEQVFHQLQQDGAIDGLEIFDLSHHPHLAQQYQIRSVPYYLINGMGFSGLKSQREIVQILELEQQQKMQSWIREQLSDGQLDEVEGVLKNQVEGRAAMLALLENSDTELVVRIGLTAIIESLADSGILNELEDRFIGLADHAEERVAIDALYYLQLLSTPQALQKLTDIMQYGKPVLRQQAEDLLQESVKEQGFH